MDIYQSYHDRKRALILKLNFDLFNYTICFRDQAFKV